MALIQVRVKETGQLGTMDDSEFDPNVFEQVQAPTPAPTQPPTPAPTQPPQPVATDSGGLSANIGSKAIGLLKGIFQGPGRLGSSLGVAGAEMFSPDVKALEASQKELQTNIDTLFKKSIDLRGQGKTKEADRLTKLAQQQSKLLEKQFTQKGEELTKAEEDAVKGAVGTGAFFVPGGKTPLTRILAAGGAGSLGGFGASERGEELQSTVGGGLFGLAIGASGEVLFKGFSKLIKPKKPSAKVKLTGSKLKKDPFFASGKNC